MAGRSTAFLQLAERLARLLASPCEGSSDNTLNQMDLGLVKCPVRARVNTGDGDAQYRGAAAPHDAALSAPLSRKFAGGTYGPLIKSLGEDLTQNTLEDES